MPHPLLPSTKWRTPFPNQTQFIHGGDYNPDQWLPDHPDILEQDAKLFRQTGINSASIGIFSWSSLEPSEGTFTFDWLDRVMDQQAKLGNRVILATPSGAMPTWLAEKYPDARRVDAVGRRKQFCDRHNHCWSSPSYHERVKIIDTKLAERYGQHPALAMWHVSNELNGECYCDLCRANWAKWLEARYGNLKALNSANWAYFWAHQAFKWEHVEPTDVVMDNMAVDWRRFNNQQLINWYTHEADILRAFTPAIPITTNFMTTMLNLNYDAISRVVDVVADDQYPSFDSDSPDFALYGAFWSMKQDLYRCFKPGQSFMLMESCPGAIQWRLPHKAKRPGIHRLEMMQAIAHGADGVCYFQFRSGRGSMEKLHGAVVEHWDTEKHTQTRRYRELRSLSDTLEKIAPVLGTGVKPQVAILYDWESRWGQHFSMGTGVKSPEWHVSWLNYYDGITTEQYSYFWQRGIPVDVIPDDRDFAGYKLLIIPMHWMMTAQLSSKLRDFVQAGGTIISTWDTAMTDKANRMLLGGWPGEGLGEVFGVWVEEIDRLPVGTPRAIAGLPGSGSDVACITHLTGATPLATFASDFYTGQPAVTHNPFGNGHAYFIGTRLNTPARDALYDRATNDLSLERIIDADLPLGVTAQLRGTADEAFVFLLNFSAEEKTVPLGSRSLVDAETGETFKREVTLEAVAARVFKITR